MRRVPILVSLSILLVAVAAPSAQAAQPTSPFTGEWIGQDPAPPNGDGSTVHLDVSGGSRPRITFTDEFGSVCVSAGASDTLFVGMLRGVVDGDTLDAKFNVAMCGHTVLRFLRGELAVWTLDDMGTSDPSDDTLSDGSVTWFRA